jgi:hypothetical protein
MAQDRDMQQGDVPTKAPISAHPVFPVLVGLWFAALLGLGTIVPPSSVIESAAGWTHGSLTPGMRAAFAFMAALAGFVGGLILARRFGKKQTVARAPRRRARLGEDRPVPPRPLSVHEDLDEEAIAPVMQEARKPLPGRRRQLAVAEDKHVDDVPLLAPVPGGNIDSLPPVFADEPAPPEIAVEAHVPEAYIPAPETGMPRDPAAPSHPAIPQPIDAPLEDLGIVQLVERLGRSIQRRLSEAKLPEPDLTAETAVPTQRSVVHGEAAAGAFAVPPPVVPEALRAFMDGSPEEIASPPLPAREPVEPAVAGVPKAFRPFAFDEHDADEDEESSIDETFGSLLSMNRAFLVADDFHGDDSGDAAVSQNAGKAGQADESTCPANVARPFDTPLQPARGAPDATETDRALRSVLANLQRMSGAA